MSARAASAGPDVWLWRALVALLSAGVLALLYSFVQVVSQPRARPVLAQAKPSPAKSNATVSMPWAENIVQADPSSAGPAATIETLAPASPPQRSAENTAISASSVHRTAHAATATMPVKRAQLHPQATPGASSAQAEAPKSTRSPARRSDDVGLIEVVMTHAMSRRIPPSAQESLNNCATLTEPEASACQAMACSQHPSALQCLDKAP